MVIAFAILATAVLGPASATTEVQPARVVPTVYEAGRFYAVPQTMTGQRLRLLVDTAGGGGSGMYWITSSAAKRLGLETRTCEVGDASIPVADVPAYRSGAGLLPPLASRSPCGKTLIVRGNHADDGQLGAGYFPGRVWTFDYPSERLTVEGSSWQPAAGAHATKLGFKRNAKGEIGSGFARIAIQVAGQTINMLLDTGATAHPSKAGEKASGIPTVNGEGATSYIVHSVFERWHKQHPEWRVVNDGDNLLGPNRQTRIIEVPNVQIAGWTVGPVWFTERPDANFHQFMGKWMDEQPDGAVGGNIFRHFAMTIDYPDASAYFRCMQDCRAAKTAND